MASGNITKRKTKKGIHYEITVEGERDPETGKRQRFYKRIDGSEKEAKAELRRMITEVEQGIAVRKLPKTSTVSAPENPVQRARAAYQKGSVSTFLDGISPNSNSCPVKG